MHKIDSLDIDLQNSAESVETRPRPIFSAINPHRFLYWSTEDMDVFFYIYCTGHIFALPQ